MTIYKSNVHHFDRIVKGHVSESVGTSHPSPKAHPVSSPGLESDRNSLTGTWVQRKIVIDRDEGTERS